MAPGQPLPGADLLPRRPVRAGEGPGPARRARDRPPAPGGRPRRHPPAHLHAGPRHRRPAAARSRRRSSSSCASSSSSWPGSRCATSSGGPAPRAASWHAGSERRARRRPPWPPPGDAGRPSRRDRGPAAGRRHGARSPRAPASAGPSSRTGPTRSCSPSTRSPGRSAPRSSSWRSSGSSAGGGRAGLPRLPRRGERLLDLRRRRDVRVRLGGPRRPGALPDAQVRRPERGPVPAVPGGPGVGPARRRRAPGSWSRCSSASSSSASRSTPRRSTGRCFVASMAVGLAVDRGPRPGRGRALPHDPPRGVELPGGDRRRPLPPVRRDLPAGRPAPRSLQPVALALPTTWWLEGVRRALLGVPTPDLLAPFRRHDRPARLVRLHRRAYTRQLGGLPHLRAHRRASAA